MYVYLPCETDLAQFLESENLLGEHMGEAKLLTGKPQRAWFRIEVKKGFAASSLLIAIATA